MLGGNVPRDRVPNVLVIVLDDLGFAQLGCFGSDIQTPAINELAQQGLRYNRFHVTALCSPTRACLLTGRNHHRVGMGWLTEGPSTAPGYSAKIPKSAGTLPRILRDSGYSSFAIGKWHLTPANERSAAGPFDRWPLGMGFERYYGFLSAETNQWTPELVSDNGFVSPNRGPAEGYHLTEDLTDRAIKLIQDQQQACPGKPFFMYYALGAMHAPHQAPKAAIDHYRGSFDEGWDVWRSGTLKRQKEVGVVPREAAATPRPPWVPAWEDLSAQDRFVCAREMEVFAGFLSHTDAQIGRLLGALEDMELRENTLVMLLSDNGTSSEGGLHGSDNYHRVAQDLEANRLRTLQAVDELGGVRSYGHYAWGWAWAGNSPFWLWKRFTWLGGVRTPLIVSWPRMITEQGAVRSQFCHAVDIAPTILNACSVTPPETIDGTTQSSFDGASLYRTLLEGNAPSPRSTQYFEMVGSRSIYHDGWKATTDHVGSTPQLERDLIPGSHDYDTDHWALFRLADDFAEVNDLSGQYPHVAQQMSDLWWSEAERNDVLPLDDGWFVRASQPATVPPKPTQVVLRPLGSPVAEVVLPTLHHGFHLSAEIRESDGYASGVLCALGDWNQGWSWYLLNGIQVFALSLRGRLHRLEGSEPTDAGYSVLEVSYRRRTNGEGGTISIVQNGTVVCGYDLGENLPHWWQIGHPGLYVGRHEGFPVTDEYETPFALTAALSRIVLASSPTPDVPDLHAEQVEYLLRHE